MKKRIIGILKYSIFLLIGAGLVWWQISGMTPEEKDQFVASLRSARYIYILPVVIMGLFSHYFRALRWKLLIDPIKKVSVWNTFYAVMLGYFGNNFVPRAGEILRCTMLGKYEKVPFSKLFGTVVVERIFDMVCFLLFILLTIGVEFSLVKQFVAEKTEQIADEKAGNSFGMRWLWIIIAIGVVFLLLTLLFRRYAKNKVVAMISAFWAQLKEGISTIFHLKNKSLFLVYTLIIWLLYLLQVYVGFFTIGATENLGMGAAMSVLTLSTIAMIVSPGGLGAFPIAVQQVLLVYGVSNISFGWLVWGIETGIIVLAGIVCFILIIYKNRKRNEKDRFVSRENIQSAGS